LDRSCETYFNAIGGRGLANLEERRRAKKKGPLAGRVSVQKTIGKRESLPPYSYEKRRGKRGSIAALYRGKENNFFSGQERKGKKRVFIG